MPQQDLESKVDDLSKALNALEDEIARWDRTQRVFFSNLKMVMVALIDESTLKPEEKTRLKHALDASLV